VPRYDAHHYIVKRALAKAGWTVTRDHLLVKYNGLHVFIDLAAERLLPDDPDKQAVAVEIKVFGGSSFLSDFEKAIGQYHLYRFLLTKSRSHRVLFLAITEAVYREHFSIPAVQEYLAEERIQLLIFAPETEEILEWIT
jgi:hypothetical protein